MEKITENLETEKNNKKQIKQEYKENSYQSF